MTSIQSFVLRRMYYSDWAEDLDHADQAKIEMSNMDGSDRSILVDHGVLWPNGLSLDVNKNILYWCDAFWDKIDSIDLSSPNLTSKVCTHKKHY